MPDVRTRHHLADGSASSGAGGAAGVATDNVREDFSNAIYNIDPTATPFMSGIAKGGASSTLTEWQVDDLHDVNPNNAAIDGADAGADESEGASRINNTCQISTKVIRTSGRAETVDKAGRRSEMGYQLAKAAKSIKRDQEAIMTSPTQGAVAGNGPSSSGGGAPDLLGGLNAWFATGDAAVSNRYAAAGTAGGADTGGGWQAGGPAAVVLAGTPAALKESTLRSVIKGCYEAGGDPGVIMCSPTNKQNLSEYLFTSSARVAALFRDTASTGSGQATATGAVDVFVSDFGALKIEPNRFLGHNGTSADDEHMYVLDMGMWELKNLRSYRTIKLATTGDAQNRELLVDYTLCARNQQASGVIDTIDGTAAVTP